METVQVLPRVELPRLVLRWIARVGSVVSIGLIAMMAIGEPGVPTMAEAAALSMFPVCVAVGMIWAWWNELLGGLISVLSLAGFYVVMFAIGGGIPGGPYFLIFSSPGFLFLACGLYARLSRAK